MRDRAQLGFGRRLWLLLYPLLAYEAVSVVVGLCGAFLMMVRQGPEILKGLTPEAVYELLTKSLDSGYYIWIQAITAILSMAVLLLFMKEDKKKEIAWGIYEKYEAVPLVWYGAALILGAAGCVFVNHVMIYSRLMELFYSGFESTAETLYQGSLLPELAVYGILTPIVEEMIFRGLVYRRLKWFSGPRLAMVLSAIYFGAFHVNFLQFLYAAALGLLFAFTAEQFHTVWAAVAVHAAANIMSLLISEGVIFAGVYDNNGLFLFVSLAAMLLTGAAFYLIYTYVYPRKLLSARPADAEPEDTFRPGA